MNQVAFGLFLLGMMHLAGCTSRENQANSKAEANLPLPIASVTHNMNEGTFTWQNGICFQGNQAYTGVLVHSDSLGNLISKQQYYHGKEEGWSEWYYPDGRMNARRYFRNGEKDSVHLGWWPNGRLRFEYHFKQGQYEGWFREWYVSGIQLKAIWYEGGKEIRGTGWRENGKIYMSFEVRNGRLYGLVNPNLCYSLQKEKGVFVDAREK